MKKTLFLATVLGTALCSAVFAETVTVNGQTYENATIITAAPTETITSDYIVIGANITAQNVSTTQAGWITNLGSDQTIISAPATAEDGTTYAGSTLFLDTGNKGNVEVNAKIMAGGADNNSLRFWGGNTIKLNGDLEIVGSQLNLWCQNATHELNGKLIGNEGQVLRSNNTNPSSGTLKINGSLESFNGTIKVDGATVQLNSLAGGLQMKAGSTANFSGGKITSASGTIETSSSELGECNIIAAGGSRIAVTKQAQNLTLKAKSEQTFASITTTGNRDGWILAQGIGDTVNNLYTDINLNSTHAGHSGLILTNANTTVHIGALSGTSSTATVRGDWGSGSGRVLVLHQDTNTTFAGKFIECSDNGGMRDIALVKEGTGTLNLTANQTSRNSLTINGGTVSFAAGAAWTGNMIVNSNGTLNVTMGAGDVTEEIAPTETNGFSTIMYGRTYGDKLVVNDGGNVTINGAAATYADGVLASAASTSTTYYVNVGENVSSLSGATALVVNSTAGLNQFGMSNTTYAGLDITINGGRVITARNNGTGFTTGDVTVKGGGTLAVVESGQDALGWGGNATKSISLLGNSTEQKATFELSYNGTGSLTMATALNMQGYSQVTGNRSFNTYGGKITAEGKDNTISVGIYLRQAGEIEVKEGGELLISGALTSSDENNCAYSLTKTGEGVLTISGTISGTASHIATINGDGANTILISASIQNSTLNNVTLDKAGLTLSGTVSINTASMNHALTNNSTLSLGGTITYTGELVDEKQERTQGNGFGTLIKKGTLISGGSGSTTIAEGTSWKINDNDATYADGKVSYNAGDSDIYYVNDATGTVDVQGANQLQVKANTTLAEGTYTMNDFVDLVAGAEMTLTGSTSLNLTNENGAKGIWMKQGATINLQDSASLTVTDISIAAMGEGSKVEATGANGQIGTNNATYHQALTITDAAVTETGATLREYNIAGGKVKVDSGTTTTVNATLSANNKLTSLELTANSIAKFGDVDVALNELTMAGGSQVTLGGDTHNQSLTLTKLTVTDENAVINANLDLTNATVVLNGKTVELGCTLTLGNTTLNDALPLAEGDTLDLFTGVDSLTLGTASYSTATTVDAYGYIANVQKAGEYNLVYTGVAENATGMVSIKKVGDVPTPEPTTGTLSLLALAGLMARRRRK